MSKSFALPHEVTLRQKYNNPRLLVDVLDKMFGRGNYKVKVG